MLRFVINMDKSKNRWDLISRELASRHIPVERISGVDGSKLSENELKTLLEPLSSRVKEGFPKGLTPGEVGCFLSHRECWKRLLQSDQKWALILEDDIILSERAAFFMNSEKWIPEGSDLIQLHSLFSEKVYSIGPKTIDVGNGTELVEPIRPVPLGTQSYLISRSAAEFALEKSRKIPAPVDEFLFSPLFCCAQKYAIWRLDPCVVVPNQVSSEIGSKKRTQLSPIWIRFGLRRSVGKAKNRVQHWFSRKKCLTFK